MITIPLFDGEIIARGMEKINGYINQHDMLHLHGMHVCFTSYYNGDE